MYTYVYIEHYTTIFEDIFFLQYAVYHYSSIKVEGVGVQRMLPYP